VIVFIFLFYDKKNYYIFVDFKDDQKIMLEKLSSSLCLSLKIPVGRYYSLGAIDKPLLQGAINDVLS